MVLKAFEDNLSVGEIKLPAALLTTTDGNEPVKSCIRLTVSLTALASRISHANGKILAKSEFKLTTEMPQNLEIWQH